MIDKPFGPAVPSVPLADSPLTFVVAQIRFPLVASISEERFIGPFQEWIRQDYPDLKKEIEAQVVVGPDGAHAAQGGTVWRFTDDAHGWEVALAPEFIALATKTYSDRADFSMAFARGRSSDSISPTEPSSTSLLRAGSIWQPRSLPQPPQSSAPDA